MSFTYNGFDFNGYLIFFRYVNAAALHDEISDYFIRYNSDL